MKLGRQRWRHIGTKGSRPHVAAWDGFKESDYNVEDGENFRLEIRFTDGTGIVASGDNAFPDNYSDAMEAMWRILTWNAGDGSEQ